MTVVGARPNFVKLAPLSLALRRRAEEVLVHTGQHYDAAMSDDLFAELHLPAPDCHLGVGPGASPLAQIARILTGLEPLLQQIRPDFVVVYGDTNSAVGAALAAVKLGLPLAHVEAGLRSFDRTQPEEHNRVLADHVSSLRLAPTATAVRNLHAEGIDQGVHRVGDVMLDAFLAHAARAALPDGLGVRPRRFYYMTAHRAENVDRRETLGELVGAAAELDLPVVFPVHPRTRARLGEFGLHLGGAILPLDPLGYLQSIALAREARAVLTDSGGLLREAFFLGTPCVTLRVVTEWVETLSGGRNILGGTTRGTILAAVERLPEAEAAPDARAFGDGRAAERIAELLCGP